jgi:peptide/nickel transport system ATP-binding protein
VRKWRTGARPNSQEASADVLQLLAELRDELGLTYLFISHDLGSVRQIADRVAVMYMGRLAEIGSTDDVLDRPRHPYTQALLAATPNVSLVRRERRRALVRGEIPDPRRPPSGCRFRTRCPLAVDRCGVETPELPPASPHAAACHLTDQAARVWSAEASLPIPGQAEPVPSGPTSRTVNSNHR